jgi:hypothetical protein
VTEETTGLSFLLSTTTLLLALVAFYVGRSLWIARREWPHCRADTKILYLMVAPPLTLAVDILEFTDRIFWSRWTAQSARPKTAIRRASPVRPTKVAFRSDGRA